MNCVNDKVDEKKLVNKGQIIHSEHLKCCSTGQNCSHKGKDIKKL